MKKKFLVCTLCFTIVFSSLNIKKSYADAGVISLPMLATIGSLAVATGVVLNSNESLYSLGKSFYDYVDSLNDLTYDAFKIAFDSSVKVLSNGFVSVDSNLLDIVKNFLDYEFSDSVSDSSYVPSFFYMGLPVYGNRNEFISSPGLYIPNSVFSVASDFSYAGLDFEFYHEYSKYYSYRLHGLNGSQTHFIFGKSEDYAKIGFALHTNEKYLYSCSSFDSYTNTLYIANDVLTQNIYSGIYDWDNVESKKENNSVALPIPGNLGNLVGQNSKDFWDNTNGLVGSGDISIPNVSNPSISLDGTTSFPNTNVDTGNPSIPDTGDPSIPNNWLDIFPPWGGGIDFTPVTQSSFIDKFPFSLGNDIKNILDIFDVDPIAPKFKVPIVSETIELDLTEFEQLASIVRFFILVGFIISLILITRSVIG